MKKFSKNNKSSHHKQRNLLPKTIGFKCILFLVVQSLPSYLMAETNSHGNDEQSNATQKSEAQFDLSFLQGGENLDPNLLNYNDKIIPGSYLVDLYINNKFMQVLNIQFKIRQDKSVEACFPEEVLLQAGIKDNIIKEQSTAAGCLFASDIAPGSDGKFESSTLKYYLTIPTIYLDRRQNFASPSQWTYGINAAFANYYVNHYRSARDSNPFSGKSNYSTYANFDTGINFEKWRLRSQVSYSSTSKRKWDSNSTYLQRALPNIRSEITLGQTYTSGALFDGIGFRGMRISSDERMLPEDQRGYAPIIAGTANSNALVRILQNGVLINEISVAPGAFYINDLTPLYGGDIDVEVHEENGEIRTFSVPSTLTSQALRPGLSRYSFSLGETHEKNKHNTFFEEFTFEYGLTNYLTLNTGFQVSNNDYLSTTLGTIFPTQFGTLIFRAHYAYLDKAQYGANHGFKYSATYERGFLSTGTFLSLGYQIRPNANYVNLSESLDYEDNYYIKRNNNHERFEMRLSQSLFGYGSIFGNAIFQNYQDNLSFDSDFQLGYANNYKSINYNILYTKQKRKEYKDNDVISLQVSFPLGTHKRRPTMTTGLTYNNQNHNTNLQTQVYGSLDEERTLSYSLNASRQMKDDHNTSVGFSLNKSAPFGLYGLSYNKGSSYSQFTANARGALAIHNGGVTLGQYIGQTFAIIEAPYAHGAKFDNFTNVRIDRFGYAVLPSLSPYHYNRITLNPAEVYDLDVELKQTEQFIAPYAGAIAKVSFATVKGKTLLITLKTTDNKLLPMGAVVLNEAGAEIGMVGQGSQAYAKVDKPEGILTVRWGLGSKQQCYVPYTTPQEKKDEEQLFVTMDKVCHF